MKRTHGAVSLMSRSEMVLVPPQCAFFSPEPVHRKARQNAWPVIKETSSLLWVILTFHPEQIRDALPSDWIGKGYRNVCFGAVADNPGHLGETVRLLKDLPCRFRMVLFPSVPQVEEIRDHLSEIQWVVVVGNEGGETHADEIRSTCLLAGVPLLFVQQDGSLTDPSVVEGEARLLEHPFGSKLDLRRPTHPDLRPTLSASLTSDILPPCTEAVDVRPEAAGNEREVENSDPPCAVVPPVSDSAAAENLLTEHPPQSCAESELPSEEDRRDFDRLDIRVRKSAAMFVECGLALAEIHDRKLWRAGGHSSWQIYVQKVLGMSKPHAHRLAQAARFATEISESLPIGNGRAATVIPVSESQMRPLYRLKEPGQRLAAWALATDRSDGQPSAKIITEVVAELMAEETGHKTPRASPAQNAHEMIGRLRQSVTAGCSQDQVLILLDELESLLKPTCRAGSRRGGRRSAAISAPAVS